MNFDRDADPDRPQLLDTCPVCHDPVVTVEDEYEEVGIGRFMHSQCERRGKGYDKRVSDRRRDWCQK